MDDIIKPLTELPADADITKSDWSWYFTDEGKGAIRHITSEGVVTAYELPLAVSQVVTAVKDRSVLRLQSTIKNALGITSNVG